jgi:hypothetical protein
MQCEIRERVLDRTLDRVMGMGVYTPISTIPINFVNVVPCDGRVDAAPPVNAPGMMCPLA